MNCFHNPLWHAATMILQKRSPACFLFTLLHNGLEEGNERYVTLYGGSSHVFCCIPATTTMDSSFKLLYSVVFHDSLLSLHIMSTIYPSRNCSDERNGINIGCMYVCITRSGHSIFSCKAIIFFICYFLSFLFLFFCSE